eukprot:COSAG02_NODE_1280_length_13477_cov_9.042906_10_plen_924_part_00
MYTSRTAARGVRYAPVAANESGSEARQSPSTGGEDRMEKNYGPLSRDSTVDVGVDPTGALPAGRGGGSPWRVSATEDQPLMGEGVQQSDEGWSPRRKPRIKPTKTDKDGQPVADKSESINWWAGGPDAVAGDTYRKCLKAQSEIDQKSQKREVLELAGGYEKVDPKRIEPWPLWDTTLEELGTIGGTGVRLYFRLLSELPFLFLKLALLNTPTLLVNLYGADNMYDSPDMTKQYKSFGARSTLGSVYADPESLNDGTETDMFVRVILDGLSLVVLLDFVLKWPKIQAEVVERSDLSSLTMADYTVSVRPPTGWLALDNQLFDRTDEDDKQADKFKQKLKASIEEKMGKTGAVAELPDGSGKPAIWLAYDEPKTIQLSKQKVTAMRALEVALAKAHSAKWEKKSIENVHKAAEKCKTLNEELNKVRTNRAKSVEAWVTFNLITEKEAAIEIMKGSMEFHGQACILGEPSEPETLFWDRLHIQPSAQKVRSCGILALTIVVLACGFAGVIITDVMKGNLDYLTSCTGAMTVDASAPNGTLGYCDPFTMRETELDQAGTDAQRYYSEAFLNLIDEVGMDGQFPRAVSALPDAARPRTYPADYQCDVNEGESMEGCCEYDDTMTWQSARDHNCTRVDAKPAEITVDGLTSPATESLIFKYADKDAICYMCICECEDPKPGMPSYNETAPGCTPTIDDEYCDSYRDYRAHLKNFKLLATFVVVAINAIIKKLIVATQPAMGLHNIGKDMGSIAFRVFLLQLCMTGVLVVLLRADIPAMSMLPSEKYRNVSAKWYAAVGSPLIKTMAVNFCMPPCLHFAKTSVFNLVGRIKAGRAITQNQMNMAYKSSTKEWNLAASYGELLLSLAVTLAYSSGVPLLLWVATFGFTLKFWVEKWCLLRRYQKPPLMSDSSAFTTAIVAPFRRSCSSVR